MKLRLKIVAATKAEVIETLRSLAADMEHPNADSNGCVERHNTKFDYDFLDTNDLWENDPKTKVLNQID